MYRNYGNFGQGTDQNFPANSSGSGSSSANSSSSSTQDTGAGSTQHQQVSPSHTRGFVMSLHKVARRPVITWCYNAG